VALRRV